MDGMGSGAASTGSTKGSMDVLCRFMVTSTKLEYFTFRTVRWRSYGLGFLRAVVVIFQ